jgi:hypothetical protein
MKGQEIIAEIVDSISKLDFVDAVEMKVLSKFSPEKYQIDVKLKSDNQLNESINGISSFIPDYTFMRRFLYGKCVFTAELTYLGKKDEL